jgi:hypothetical protein
MITNNNKAVLNKTIKMHALFVQHGVADVCVCQRVRRFTDVPVCHIGRKGANKIDIILATSN